MFNIVSHPQYLSNYSTVVYYSDQPNKGWGVSVSYGRARSQSMVYFIGVCTASLFYDQKTIVDFTVFEEDPVFFKLNEINKEGIYNHKIEKEFTRQYAKVLIEYAFAKLIESEDSLDKLGRFFNSIYDDGVNKGKTEIQNQIKQALNCR